MDGCPVPVAYHDICTWALFQHIGKVFGGHNWRCVAVHRSCNREGRIAGIICVGVCVHGHRVAAFVLQFGHAIMGLRREVHNLGDLFLNDVAYLWIKGTHGAVHFHHLRDDVMRLCVRMQGTDGHYHVLKRINHARCHGLQR